jgi:hypothetical protein
VLSGNVAEGGGNAIRYLRAIGAHDSVEPRALARATQFPESTSPALTPRPHHYRSQVLTIALAKPTP